MLLLTLRTSLQLKMLTLLVTGYVFGDKILKNLIQSPRPEGSCKTTFGMPSSHMTVMTLYALELWMRSKKTQKMFLLFMVVVQAIARV